MRAVFARPRVGGCSRAHPSMYSPRRPSCQSTVAAHLCSWGAAPGSEMRLQNCRNLAGGFNGKSHQSRRIPQHSSYFQWKTSDLSQGVTVLFPIVALCAVCFRVWVALRAKVFVAGGPTQAVVVLASFAGIPLENAEIRVNPTSCCKKSGECNIMTDGWSFSGGQPGWNSFPAPTVR